MHTSPHTQETRTAQAGAPQTIKTAEQLGTLQKTSLVGQKTEFLPGGESRQEHLLWSSIRRCEEAASGKIGNKTKQNKTKIPHWFHDSYWFRRRLFDHGSVVAENCPSRQRGEVAPSVSPDSESALFNRNTAISQGEVTQGKCNKRKQKQKILQATCMKWVLCDLFSTKTLDSPTYCSC